MISVESDRSKRLIVISAAGRLPKQAALQVRELVKDIVSGFRAQA